MTHPAQFISQFEKEIRKLPFNLDRGLLIALFYISVLPKLETYLEKDSVLFISSSQPSLYIVLPLGLEENIHIEAFTDRTAVYSVFIVTDLMEADTGTLEEVLKRITDSLENRRRIA